MNNPKYLPGTPVSYRDEHRELITTVECVHRHYYSDNIYYYPDNNYSDSYSLVGRAAEVDEEDLRPIIIPKNLD